MTMFINPDILAKAGPLTQAAMKLIDEKLQALGVIEDATPTEQAYLSNVDDNAVALVSTTGKKVSLENLCNAIWEVADIGPNTLRFHTTRDNQKSVQLHFVGRQPRDTEYSRNYVFRDHNYMPGTRDASPEVQAEHYKNTARRGGAINLVRDILACVGYPMHLVNIQDGTNSGVRDAQNRAIFRAQLAVVINFETRAQANAADVLKSLKQRAATTLEDEAFEAVLATIKARKDRFTKMDIEWTPEVEAKLWGDALGETVPTQHTTTSTSQAAPPTVSMPDADDLPD